MHGEYWWQIFDFRFKADLHVLGSEESKKYKINMVSGCSLVLVSMLVSLLVCGDDTYVASSNPNVFESSTLKTIRIFRIS